MIDITTVTARQILDSRGNPTVECDVMLSDGARGRAAVPSGASTGSREAIERRDGEGSTYGGKAVQGAVETVNTSIAKLLVGRDPFDQRGIDEAMIAADGTENKETFGANAILAVSLAVAKASAASAGLGLYRYVASLAGTTDSMNLPLPMMNIMNGGQHAAFATDIQEFMVIPIGAQTIEQAVEMGANIFHELAGVLREANYQTTVGDEGGYAPRVTRGNREPFEHIAAAVKRCQYELGKDVVFAIDAAASEFYHDQHYRLASENRTVVSGQLIDYYKELVRDYPIVSIEDGLDENDWENWSRLNEQLGEDVQLVGDDLLVTNVKLLQQAIEQGSANAILIKPNQIGSLSETIDAVLLAKNHGWRTIMSHRSGETEDTTIAHLAVGLGTGQIKTGSLSRSERIAKYNELLRIAEVEGDDITLAEWSSL
jgi:enolase